ncbi:MAG: TolB family protein [Gemmatimonadaceae bacterium]
MPRTCLPAAALARPVVAALLLVAALFFPRNASAQFVWRPDANWQTLRTPHFTVVYPSEFSEWARTMAERLESVRTAVGAEVGSLPAKRVTVLVTDPFSVSNGSAWPFLESPSIVVWPTPPNPRSTVGNSRSWPEILSVHEFTHIAHMTRPSRNPTERLLARLSPLGIGPITRKAPRWVLEGYATYVEGRLTGSGRPHGVWRPAILRQWALEGRLPTYAQLSSWGEYEGGSFAYLAGSAFLEWLGQRHGDSTVTQLWRRLSARTDRSFDQAFAGIYGDSPRALYGLFTVDLTGKALAVAKTLRDSSLVEGTLVQRLTWTTGDPAVSPNGQLVAVVLRDKELPSRVVVWNTADEPRDSAAATRRARAAKRDPEDVPDVQFWPRPKKRVATLRADNGYAYDSPRFFADNRRLLVTRGTVRGDGTVVRDLFEWDTKSGAVRRVTYFAGIEDADPSPDGATAVAARCTAGHCDLVRISLATGTVETLAAGSPLRAFYRPRYSPDGRTIVAAVSDSGRWRLVEFDATGLHYVGPNDGANRYDADFTRGGAILHVSERGGIPEIALLDPATGGTRTLTRVLSAAVAPSTGGGRDVYFLSLHATGVDVRRIVLDSTTDVHVVATDPTLAPAAQIPVAAADTFAVAPLGRAHRYGFGTREYRLLAGYSLAADGQDAVLGLASTDKVGRLTWVAQGGLGREWRPRGGSLAAAWRGWPVTVGGEVFTMIRDASRQRPVRFTGPADDASLHGGALALGSELQRAAGRLDARVGGAVQQLRVANVDRARTLGFASIGGGVMRRGDVRFATAAFNLQGTSGASGDAAGPARAFTRGIASASLAVGSIGSDGSSAIHVAGSYGLVGRSAQFERFAVGGSAPSFIDTTTVEQWIPMPALPFGALRGRRYASYRVSVGDETLSPYLWAGAAGDSLSRWMRVVGIDGNLSVPPLPFFRLPASAVTAGIGYSIDEPWRKKTRAYISLRYRP